MKKQKRQSPYICRYQKPFFSFFFTFIFFLTCLPWARPGPNDPVSIPDTNLRAFIETKLGKTPGEIITESEMNGMTGQFSAGEKNIRDLTGLEHATGITDLILWQNNITNLAPLRNLTQLTDLNLSYNYDYDSSTDVLTLISDLSPLKDLTNLTSLSLSSYSFSARFDTTPGITALLPLKNLTQLEYLNLSGNKIVDVSPLANLTKLSRTLNLENNQITNIETLANLTALRRLNIMENKITNIAPLSPLTNLESLLLSYNWTLSDISVVANLTNLETLWMAGINITFSGLQAVLPHLSSLDYLILNQSPISDLSVLESLPNTPQMTSLQVREMHDDVSVYSEQTGWILKDLSPLVDLMNAGKLGTGTYLDVRRNWNLDYESIYTDIPRLIAGVKTIRYDDDNTPETDFGAKLEPASAENHVGAPGTRHTFVVRATNTSSDYLHTLYPENFTQYKVNRKFEGVPVTFTVTNPDGSERSVDQLTGADGLASVSIILGSHRARYTVEAVVPENRPAAGPWHPELRVNFTATASSSVGASGVPVGSGRSISRLSIPGQISFSELMFTSDGGPDSLPQWIELHNASKTESVNLREWRLEVEGRDSNSEHQHGSITFENFPIPPNQTVLIVTSDARNSVDLPKERIYNILNHHPNRFKQYLSKNQNRVLGQNGFFLKLLDPDGGVSDVAGNLDGDRLTKDEPVWELPRGSTDSGDRISLFRHYNVMGGTPLDGKSLENWVRAADVELEVTTYWGKETDIGNPGHKGGWRFPARHVSFSELMFTSRGGLHSLPQWIELHNASETEIADLKGWELKIEALDPEGERRYAVITLDSLLIPPNQTGLIVTRHGRYSQQIPISRVYFLDVRKQNWHRNKVFGQSGFFLKLSDPKGIVTDIAGNLDGNPLTEDKPKWELPVGSIPNDARISLMRRYYRVAGIALDGKAAENWVPASDLPLKVMTYWGKETDIGNPGYTDEDIFPLRHVSFSELMFTSSGELHSLPQWIELRNDSEGETVNLSGWHLEVEARENSGKHRYVVIRLEDLSIPPNQVALIVTRHGRYSPHIPRGRIYNFFTHHYDAFKRNTHRDTVLGQSGFFLKLSDSDGRVSDTVGNLDGNKLTKDAPVWELPSGKTADGVRTSLMRQYHELGMPLDGKMLANWVPASEMPLNVITYWGKATDIGNPGYTNAETHLSEQQISFSELMFTSSGGLHLLPQWIELYNDSETETVNLEQWHLEIEAREDDGKHRYVVIRLGDLIIPPNQTALIVTGNGRNSKNISADHIYNLLWHHRDIFIAHKNNVLGQTGFSLKLSNPDGGVSDVAGNLDGDAETEDEPAWELPAGRTTDGARTSLMRRYYHVTGIPLDGRASENWVPASNLPLAVMTYWGRETDIGNPGHRGGGPLPVSLSFFRAERTDAGVAVIKWTTESEIDNAGFNILRSQTRKGQFKKINSKLITGAGTTSQRYTYTWTDTTAKPNVIYYYRLEDVSFSGDRQQLATVRLRGHISARGKLTTTWAEKKNLPDDY